mgnify:CR=1 FL=1
MDGKWFKSRKKQAGITDADIAAIARKDRSVVSKIASGQQQMTMDWAKAFAQALNVPVAEVLEQAGVVDHETAQQIKPGFAESDAAPFAGAPQQQREVTGIAAVFGQRHGVDVWQIKSNSMALAGYLPGDFMIVDTHQADRVQPGDVVVAQVYNRNGTAKTVLRRWAPPVLVAAAPPGADEPVYVVDNDNVSIRGKVTASWRT